MPFFISVLPSLIVYFSITFGGLSDSSSGIPRSSSSRIISLCRVEIILSDDTVSDRALSSLTCSVRRS